MHVLSKFLKIDYFFYIINVYAIFIKTKFLSKFSYSYFIYFIFIDINKDNCYYQFYRFLDNYSFHKNQSVY